MNDDASNDTVLCTRPEPGIALVTLNRPERLNAITNEMLARLTEVLGQIGADPACRVVVVTGAGRGFCGGLDLRANAEAIAAIAENVERSTIWADRFGALPAAIKALRQPVIAAVNGPAAGGGFMLALSSDIRLASTAARFANGFLNTGASGCELGLSFLLPRQIGMARAMEMALTGRYVDAHEALAIGLVSQVTDGDVVDAALVVGRQILAGTPFGTELTKRLMWAGVESTSLESTIELEARSQVLALMTADAAEKRAAFAEKRPAAYRPAGGVA
jgi:enoyl-CoA hydratase